MSEPALVIYCTVFIHSLRILLQHLTNSRPTLNKNKLREAVGTARAMHTDIDVKHALLQPMPTPHPSGQNAIFHRESHMPIDGSQTLCTK